MASDFDRAVFADVDDDDLLVGADTVGADPDLLAEQLVRHRVLLALEGDHRGLGRHGAGQPERDGMRHGRQPVQTGLFLGEHFDRRPPGHPMGAGTDLHAERRARRLQFGERPIHGSRFMSFGTRSAFANFTVLSLPPFEAGSAGTQV